MSSTRSNTEPEDLRSSRRVGSKGRVQLSPSLPPSPWKLLCLLQTPSFSCYNTPRCQWCTWNRSRRRGFDALRHFYPYFPQLPARYSHLTSLRPALQDTRKKRTLRSQKGYKGNKKLWFLRAARGGILAPRLLQTSWELQAKTIPVLKSTGFPQARGSRRHRAPSQFLPLSRGVL